MDKKEEILYKFRETRSPVYSYNQVMKAMDLYAAQQVADKEERIKELEDALEMLLMQYEYAVEDLHRRDRVPHTMDGLSTYHRCKALLPSPPKQTENGK